MRTGCGRRREKMVNEGKEDGLGLYTISDVSHFQGPPPRSYNQNHFHVLI
jgi:hypothetical protein